MSFSKALIELRFIAYVFLGEGRANHRDNFLHLIGEVDLALFSQQSGVILPMKRKIRT